MLPFWAVLGLFSTVVYGQAILTAYADGQCKNTTGFTTTNNETANTELGIRQTSPDFAVFDNITFSHLPAGPQSSTGSQVWWKVGQPDAGCRIIMMLPYTQPAYKDTGNQVPGNVIFNVGSPGCYYSDLPVSVLYPASYYY